MSTKISANDSDTVTNDRLNDFLSHQSLEKQVFFVFNELLSAQGNFNGTNPPNPVNRFGVIPNFSNKIVNAQASLPLSNDAVMSGIVSGAQASGIGAAKLDIESGDSVSDEELSELIGLSTLEKQLAWVTSLLSTRENEYNSANSEEQINRVTISTNFDNNTATFQVALPLSNSANLPASFVEAYI